MKSIGKHIKDDASDGDNTEDSMEPEKDVSDGVWNYKVNIVKYFMVLLDFKDAVSTSNSDHPTIL